MKIIIDYESSWRNSFLDGSNNQPVAKNGRKFTASIKALGGKDENFQQRDISIDTVLGVLNRLIGEQRKLYQSRQCFNGEKHYFEDIESSISFSDEPRSISQEIVFLRNMNKNTTDQGSFTGMVKVNDPIFQSDYSAQFWSVLSLDVDQLYDFILNDNVISNSINLEPVSILSRLEVLKKLKPIENTGSVKEASEYLQSQFAKYKPLNSKGQVLLLGMYCSALYLQLQRLESQFDMVTAKSKMGGISGISNNGFTPKDFMDKYTTGPKKLIYGNPYIREEFVKGEGKIKHLLTKASGQLEISLDIDVDRAIEIKGMIDAAGVSAFYLGKKGLAYVASIDVR